MAEKVTMVLKVDLQCSCCYKKVKKILCKFPQIRDQVYDEKANKVTITVVCSNPEKIRDKLYCKGCKVIINIEIIKPEKTKQSEKSNESEKTKQSEKSNESEMTKQSEKSNEHEKTKQPKKPTCTCTRPSPCTCTRPSPCTCTDTCTCTWTCTCTYTWTCTCTCAGTCTGTCKRPTRTSCGGGPCCHGYGVPLLPQPCHDGYCVRSCDYYFSEDSPRGCSIM